ncbi:MAG: NAD-dependent protein deacylase [Candidatus Hodarchaeota archaeon]
MINDRLLSQAADIIKSSKEIVVFTGAGSSTQSGIADFRSEGGLWSRYDPSIYANYYYFLQDPSKFWEMHNELVDILSEAQPNLIHYSVVELEKLGKVKAIITQNIDGLHQRAGSIAFKDIPIFELHGSYLTLECIACKKELQFKEVNTKNVKFPICECGGYIKPKVVLFGESLPYDVLESAIQACKTCDSFIMVGSSLLVSPANLLPQIAKQSGAKVIFINRDNTIMDDLADVFLKGNGGEILTDLIRLLR